MSVCEALYATSISRVDLSDFLLGILSAICFASGYRQWKRATSAYYPKQRSATARLALRFISELAVVQVHDTVGPVNGIRSM